MAADRSADRPSDAASTDAGSPTTPTDTPPTIATWTLSVLDTPPTTARRTILSAWAKWAASTTFSSTDLMSGSGYDKQEVDAFRSAVRDTFLGVRKPPLRSDDVPPGKRFSTQRRGYHKTQVDVFVEVAHIRLAAMESTDLKVTVVYESLFGNTRKVAQAISDGVREAHPDAHVDCVAVGRASAELINSTDLLIVGGPTHRRRMTTDVSRKRQIGREKKAEAKGEPPHELEPDAEGTGLREWFYLMRPEPKGRGKGWGHAAAFDTRLGSALARTGGACYGIARKLSGHGYELVKDPHLILRRHGEGFILDGAYGPLHAGEIEWAKEWGARVVRTSVANPEGWAIWDRWLVSSNE